MGAEPEEKHSNGEEKGTEKSVSPTLHTCSATHNHSESAALPSAVSPSCDSSWSRKSWATVSVALNVLLLYSVSHLYYERSSSHSVQTVTQRPNDTSTDFDRRAIISPKNLGDPCSGHGEFYGGSSACTCHACFTGMECSTIDRECVLDLDRGDPKMFEEYWRIIGDSATTLIPGWLHTSYHGNSEHFLFGQKELEDAIRDLHALVGNAVTEGRHIIVGAGSTQLYQATLYALSSHTQPTPTSVVSEAPYYSQHAQQTDFFRSQLFKWAGDAATFEQTADYNDGAAFIEIVTTPSNPTGEIRYPLVKGTGGARVYDLAYYWPHFTPITAPMDEDVMLFTLSKITGHAGTRIGWAIVKDLKVAKKMDEFMGTTLNGASKDSQLRAVHILRLVMEGYNEGERSHLHYAPPARLSVLEVSNAQEQPMFHYAASEMAYRWGRLRSAIKGAAHLKLIEFQPAWCTFFNKMNTATPSFAWIQCNYEKDCTKFLKSHGIVARAGPLFGVDSTFSRLSTIDRRGSFEILIDRLEALEAQSSARS